VRRSRRVGRPKQKPPQAKALLTRRVRRLIDLAYDGNLRTASLTTGLPYTTLRSLYTGRTLNPGIRTLQILADRHGFSESWFLRDWEHEELPMGGLVGRLSNEQGKPRERRYDRETRVPYAAWPLIEVYTLLGEYLDDLPPSPSRPILGDANDGREVCRRLTAFLFAPLLAAEKLGEPTKLPGEFIENLEPKLKALQALGRLWEQALPELLGKARAWAQEHGKGPPDWMGYHPDREGAGGRPKASA
jgi:hypothetical protein